MEGKRVERVGWNIPPFLFLKIKVVSLSKRSYIRSVQLNNSLNLYYYGTKIIQTHSTERTYTF